MRKTTSPLRSAALLLTALFALGAVTAGCGGDDSGTTKGMVLRVFNSSTTQSEGFPPSIEGQIVEVRVRIYQNGRERSDLTRSFDFSEPSGRLPVLAFGENYQIVVEAIGNDPANPLADGATPIFDYSSSSNISEIQVFTSALGSVEFASALFTSGSQVISLPSEFEGWFVADSRGEPRTTYGGQRAGHTSTELSDGRIVVIGGARLTDAGGIGGSPIADLSDTIEVYNPFTGYWTLVLDQEADPDENGNRPALRLSSARAFHTATLLDDGRIMVVGGFESDGSAMATSSRADIIDVDKGAIQVLGYQSEDLFDPRALHTAHWIGGKLYVVGGVGRFYDSASYLSSVEVYDPSAGFFERAIDAESGADLELLEGRGMHTAHTLADGLIVIAGRTSAGVTNTMEFFELSGSGLRRFFNDAGSLPRINTPRFGHESVLMRPDLENSTPDDPTVYIAIAGGYISADAATDVLHGTALTNTIEFIDERSFAVQANLQLNMATPRAHFSLVETDISYDLMIMGGITTDNVTTNGERFLRNEFGGFPLQGVNFGALNRGRAFGTGIVLDTHNVMLIGGWEGGSDASACGDVINTGCTSELANPGDLFFLGFLYQ